MLQRAKWEKFSTETTNLATDSAMSSNKVLQYWAASQPVAAFAEWSSIVSPLPLTGGRVAHAGVFCEDSGIVKATARMYDENGSLKSVAFLEGSVVP